MTNKHTNASLDTQEVIDNLHLETAKINWEELQRFFAGGKVILVSKEVDILKVAASMVEDKASEIQNWMEDKTISSPSDEQAAKWYENKEILWALVLNPWVLVQEI